MGIRRPDAEIVWADSVPLGFLIRVASREDIRPILLRSKAVELLGLWNGLPGWRQNQPAVWTSGMPPSIIIARINLGSSQYSDSFLGISYCLSPVADKAAGLSRNANLRRYPAMRYHVGALYQIRPESLRDRATPARSGGWIVGGGSRAAQMLLAISHMWCILHEISGGIIRSEVYANYRLYARLMGGLLHDRF